MTSLAVAAMSLLVNPTASADPTSPATTTASPSADAGAKGRGAGTVTSTDPLERAQVLRRVAETA